MKENGVKPVIWKRKEAGTNTMGRPMNFSWVEPNLLAGLAYPIEKDDLIWLRNQGIQILLTLTETPLSKKSIDDAGLLSIHEPIADYHAPTWTQLDRCVSLIRSAHEKNMAVGVHCAAGIGRTGTILTAWLISTGLSPDEALKKVRTLRPGSVETPLQIETLRQWAKNRKVD